VLKNPPPPPADRGDRGASGGPREARRERGPASGPRPSNGNGSGQPEFAPAPAATGPVGTRQERLFLALCIAVPEAGTKVLEVPEAELLLASEALRRVARHLRGRVRSPMSDLPADDEPFAREVAGLVALAGRVPEPDPDRLEHARLVLDLDRLERAIRRARVMGEGTNELAQERELVRAALRDVVARLEKTI
jgi:hypothetical protein